MTEKTTKDSVYFTLRLNAGEAVRYTRIVEIAEKRNPYIRKSDINRELVGLSEPLILSENEINFFRGKVDNMALSSMGQEKSFDQEAAERDLPRIERQDL